MWDGGELDRSVFAEDPISYHSAAGDRGGRAARRVQSGKGVPGRIAANRGARGSGRAWRRRFPCLRSIRGFGGSFAAPSTRKRGLEARKRGPQSQIRGSAVRAALGTAVEEPFEHRSSSS